MADEKQLSIQIELGPAGLTVKAAYQGSLSSIPEAVKRLQELGNLELVSGAARTPVQAQSVKPKIERVEPRYNEAGEPICPVHKRVLSEGAHGLFCSAKAKPDQVADRKGYCGLKFAD